MYVYVLAKKCFSMMGITGITSKWASRVDGDNRDNGETGIAGIMGTTGDKLGKRMTIITIITIRLGDRGLGVDEVQQCSPSTQGQEERIPKTQSVVGKKCSHRGMAVGRAVAQSRRAGQTGTPDAGHPTTYVVDSV